MPQGRDVRERSRGLRRKTQLTRVLRDIAKRRLHVTLPVEYHRYVSYYTRRYIENSIGILREKKK